MSELVYVYVEQIYSRIRKQSVNFSNKYAVSYDGEKLQIEEKGRSLPENFWSSKISNISLIIGKNGIGKSSLLDLISFGQKNRQKFIPRVQFFQIFHVDNDLFYFEGSSALKNKLFGQQAPSANDFFFEVTSKNEFVIQPAPNNFVMDINYQKLMPRIDWVDKNSITNERSRNVNRYLNSSVATIDILNFLSEQQNVFQSENVVVKIKQRKNYNRSSADILYCLYQGSERDLRDKEEGFSSIIDNINRRFGGGQNQKYYNRGIQDSIYGNYKKDYFILRLLEKEVIGSIQEAINQNRISIVEEVLRRKKDRFYIEFSHDEKGRSFEESPEINYRDELYSRTGYMLNLLEFLQHDEQQLRKKARPMDYSRLVGLLSDIDASFFDTTNILSFKLADMHKIEANVVAELSEKYHDMLLMKFRNLSDGEMVYLNTFVKIKTAVDESENLLLVLDEPDLNLHPEWSRRFIQNLVTTVDNYSQGRVQVVMSSHSPFLVTDFPRENVFMISETEKKKEKLIQPAHKSFAGNLYDVALDSFFLDFPMGEFVRNKLNHLDQKNRQEQAETINLIDDSMLQNILIDSYELKRVDKKGDSND